jgi:hypothetical protein
MRLRDYVLLRDFVLLKDCVSFRTGEALFFFPPPFDEED